MYRCCAPRLILKTEALRSGAGELHGQWQHWWQLVASSTPLVPPQLQSLTGHALLVLQAIQRQLEEVEERQRISEIQGVRLEKVLRGEAGTVSRSESGIGLAQWAGQKALITCRGQVNTDIWC